MSPEGSPSTAVSRVPFQLRVGSGRVIRGDVRFPEATGPHAIVVCHGFKGFKDWGFFPYLSDRLATGARSAVVSFNFSGSGIGPDLQDFTDLESFSRNTFSQELADLEAILDGLAVGRLGDALVAIPRRVGLIGHSRGAAAVVLVGESRPEVRSIVTWGGIGSVFRYEEWFAEQLGDDDLMYVANMRTGQQLPIRRTVLEDMRVNRSRLDMQSAAERLDVPLLVVHGSEDEAVPLAEAFSLRDAAPAARLVVIEGASHTMDASHPFPGTNPKLEKAVDLTIDHFSRTLAQESS